jgi:isopentenyl-diphosphate delta-isomerase
MSQPPKKYPPVVVVDEHDNEIGSAMLAEAWQKGLRHRVVSVFVVDNSGRVLLQLRGPNVGIHPNCWDQSAAGHVDEGHSYEQAAVVEVAEELGLRDVTSKELEELGTLHFEDAFKDGRVAKGFERVYLLRVADGIVLTPEPEEVSELRWFTPDELTAQITQHAETCTPGLLEALREYRSTLIDS